MENNWESFDKDSKTIIKDLVNESKKFNQLVKKLQKARNTIDNKSELMSALTQEIKK